MHTYLLFHVWIHELDMEPYARSPQSIEKERPGGFSGRVQEELVEYESLNPKSYVHRDMDAGVENILLAFFFPYPFSPLLSLGIDSERFIWYGRMERNKSPCTSTT